MTVNELLDVLNLNNVSSLLINGIPIIKGKAKLIFGTHKIKTLAIHASIAHMSTSDVNTTIVVEEDIKSIEEYISTVTTLPYKPSFIRIEVEVTLKEKENQ